MKESVAIVTCKFMYRELTSNNAKTVMLPAALEVTKVDQKWFKVI